LPSSLTWSVTGTPTGRPRERRIIVASNADDFRQLGAQTPAHPGLAVMLDGAAGPSS